MSKTSALRDERPAAPAVTGTVGSRPSHPAEIVRDDAQAIAAARRLAESFAREAALRDRERRLPVAELEAFSGSGLWGITVPKAYGGPELSYVTVTEVIKLISAADPSLGQLPQNHLATLDVIRLTASEAQKQRIFGEVLAGVRLGNGFSEFKSRTVADFETKLVPRDGGFVLNGTKFYATGALFAHVVAIGAVNEAGQLHLAIIDRDAPGLSITDDWDGFGQRTTASGTLTLDNVFVTESQLVPAWRAAEAPTSAGPVSQIIQAAIDAGIAQGAIAETIHLVRTYSRPWIDSGQEHAWQDPYTISQIGDLEIRLHAAEALLERAARLTDAVIAEPTDDSAAAAQIAVAEAKVLTTEIAILATNKLHELVGTRSTLGKHNLDRHWRNARTHTLHDPVRWKYHAVGNFHLNGVKPPRHPWI